ncbi:right-handed parallel beta-helix repeat-containing protein [Geodermatophilus nigrescens]|uniref:Right handed beta helix region n=1 Tax=Geodermatophilus nigrescens TaxID=1070870 RepID=A0A1M5K6K6_9ACTN|nr:right-handed parallel beta-helix repeat-containing protein [Geodermatophilus nigrescens]SHG48452.1 Right handed beta helix region [Geodermatophilus nigrescens]
MRPTTLRAGTAAGASAFALLLLTATPAAAGPGGPGGHPGGHQSGTAVTTTADGGPGSLRAAVQAANAAGSGTIVLSARTYRLALAGADDVAATGDLDVTGHLVVEGRGATVDAARLDRVFDVKPGASLTLRQVTVTGGAVSGTPSATGGASGGGVLNAGTLVVDRSTVTGNTATRAGGGIEATAGSTTTVTRSTLSHNATGAAPGNGGGLHLTGTGTVSVDRSTVTGNTAAAEGGGLWNSATGTMTVSRTVVSGNTASGAAADNGGGGLFNDGGSLTVDRSEVRDNAATGTAGSGGGLFTNGGSLTVTRTVVDGNDARRAGGGIEALAGTTRVERSRLTGNTTGPMPGNGGGLHLTGAGTVEVDRSTVTGNTAANEGGGLWNSEPGVMTVTRSTVSGNSAPVGPDVFQDGAGDGFTVDGATVPGEV